MGRQASSSFFRADVEFAAGSADQGLLALTGGFEAGVLPSGRVIPLVIGRLGVGSCGEWAGMMLLAGGGLRVNLGGGTALRGTATLGFHGGETGPNMFMVGIERFTPRQ
jgi:hypothetical protein